MQIGCWWVATGPHMMDNLIATHYYTTEVSVRYTIALVYVQIPINLNGKSKILVSIAIPSYPFHYGTRNFS